MKSLLAITASTALLIFGSIAAAADHAELKAFPKAEDGEVRHVIVLDHKERGEEDAFMVELLPGKVMMTDGVNRVHLGAKIEPKPLKGWGYTFYKVTESGGVASTLIGVPPGTPKVEKFVAAQPIKIRYNSRLPIVIYAPKGIEIRYRIWKSDEKFSTAEES